jgi:tetratricopeptide (TPR) repeat protein
MGGNNPKIPYLISPHRTLILNATPTIRWNAVAGAIKYTVQIKHGQRTIWQTQVQETQVIYPGNPVLQTGIPYSVTIETDNGKSSQSETGNQFIILKDTDAKVVQGEIRLINQLDFSPEVKALKLAEYYTNYEVPEPAAYGLTDKTTKSYRLTADAIATLESFLKQSQSSPPLFYRMLGNFYAQTGVMRPAEQSYLQTIAQVQSLEDMEEWSLAMYGLGELYEATQDTQQAIIWYSQARVGFRLLNDQREIIAERSIERLKKMNVAPLKGKALPDNKPK